MNEPIFKKFDQNDAWELGVQMRKTAIERGYPIAIDIRRGDTPLFSVMLEGASDVNFDWARRKRNLVNLTQTSSWEHSQNAANGKNIIELMGLDPRDYTPHGGCVPIRVEGVGIVATVTISGLPQKEDHEFAFESLNAYRNMQ
jgi:uncharacterized protein (UPF0303 family)